MSITESMSELKQRYLKSELAKVGFPNAKYIAETGRLMIDPQATYMPIISDDGRISYRADCNSLVKDTIRPLVEMVNEIIGAWERSSDSPVESLSEFRILSEYNNIVLAARDDTEQGYGFHFVTWQTDNTRNWFEQGRYTQDYYNAKEDFAKRSGLIPADKIFTKEEAEEIRKSVEYRSENDGGVTPDADKLLGEIAYKLEAGYSETNGNTERNAELNVGEEIINTAKAINGSIQVGDLVISAPSDEYGYLVGAVTAIDKLGTPEHETENKTDDVHVDFYAFEYPPERIKEIEEIFSESYGEKKVFDELPLDDVIMAPDTLIRISELDTDEINRFAILENCVAFCNCFPGGIQIRSEKHAELLARIKENLTDYHNSLMSLDKRELIKKANEITAVDDVYSFIAGDYNYLKDGDFEYLLQFKNPLEVIADQWNERISDLSDLPLIISDICDKRDLLGAYPSVSDIPGVNNPVENEKTEKPSILGQIKNAPVEAKSPSGKRKDDKEL